MGFDKAINKYVGWIYKITNTQNDKIYIGQTTTSIKERWYQHCSKTRHREDNSIVHKAIEKYGEDCFNMSIVEKIEDVEYENLRNKLNEKEIYWISELNTISPNGYNILNGGGNVPIRSKEVFQFSLKGVFIKKFNSISEALREFNKNIKLSTIQKHMKTDRCAYGYLWSYDINDNPYNIYINYEKKCSSRKKVKGIKRNRINPRKKETKPRRRLKINKYDLNDNYINTYENMFVVSKEFGKKDSSNIHYCCSHKTKTAYGYKWFYADDESQPDKTRIIKAS